MQLIEFLFSVILSNAHAGKQIPCQNQPFYRLILEQNEGVEIKCIQHLKKPAYVASYYLGNQIIRKFPISKKSYEINAHQFNKVFSEVPNYRKDVSICSDLARLEKNNKKKILCGEELNIHLKNEIIRFYSSIRSNL